MITKIWEHDWKHRISKHRTWQNQRTSDDDVSGPEWTRCQRVESSGVEDSKRCASLFALPVLELGEPAHHWHKIHRKRSKVQIPCQYTQIYRKMIFMIYDHVLWYNHRYCTYITLQQIVCYRPGWHHKIKYIKIWYYVSICVFCPQLIVSFRFILRVTSSRQFQNTSDTFTEKNRAHVIPCPTCRIASPLGSTCHFCQRCLWQEKHRKTMRNRAKTTQKSTESRALLKFSMTSELLKIEWQHYEKLSECGAAL